MSVQGGKKNNILTTRCERLPLSTSTRVLGTNHTCCRSGPAHPHKDPGVSQQGGTNSGSRLCPQTPAFPQAAHKTQCFVPTRPSAIPFAVSPCCYPRPYPWAKPSSMVPSDLCGTAKGTGAVPQSWVRPPCPARLFEALGGATTVSAALCNSSLPVSPLTVSHVQAFPPEPLTGLRCCRPGHPHAGAATPSRQQSHPAIIQRCAHR